MVEAVFPPSLNWQLSKIISSREDGSIAYGTQNNIFVLKVCGKQIFPYIIIDAHKDKITSISFCSVKIDEAQNFVLSSSEDGFVKIWNIHSSTPLIGHSSHSVQKDLVKVVCATWSNCDHSIVFSAAENDTVVMWNTLNNTTTRYHFLRLRPTIIESSYYDEKILSVGSKTGMVYIIKLTGKGEIIHRLRGHDKEIQSLSWNPMPQINGDNQNYLLASSSQEKEIYIWQDNGECVVKIPLPHNVFSKESDVYHGKWEPSVTFIPLFWASPNCLYSSNKFGELISCDPLSIIQSERGGSSRKNQATKKKSVSNCWSLVHAFHSNAILAITGIPAKITDENSDVVVAGMSRELSSLDLLSRKSNFSSTNLFFNVNKGRSSGTDHHETDTVPLKMEDLIWTVGRDQKLVAYRTKSDKNPAFYLHTINGNAFVLEPSLHDPNIVAIGAADGKIRLWNVSRSSGQVRVFGQKINDRVYSVAWHPVKDSLLAFGTSEGRVGIIDIFSLKPPSNFLSRHGGKVYSLSWGPNLPADSENVPIKKSLALYSAGGLKIFRHNLSNFNSEILNIPTNVPCKRFVDLCWKPDFSLLAVGSKKGYIYILRPPTFEVICSVLATTKCVMSLTWHPRSTSIDMDCKKFKGYLTFASIDNENIIKVYNCCEVDNLHKVEQVSILKGHTGYVQCVSWSPHITGRLMSSSADYSVRIWDVETSTQLVKLIASQSILPLFSVWSPIDPDVVITGYNEMIVISSRISAVKTDPVLKVLKLERGNNVQLGELENGSDELTAEIIKELEENSQPLRTDVNQIALAKRTEDQKIGKEAKMFCRAWNTDTDSFQNCYELLKTRGTESTPNYKLSFLKPECNMWDYLRSEDESFKTTNNWSMHYQLALWKGNLKDVIEEHMALGQLDDYLVSLAPFVSPRIWQQACISYSKSLAEKKYYRKAASYLLAVHKVHEAIDMLEKVSYYLEAICIARCRLPQADSVLLNLIRSYANWLTETGNILRASECFIYLDEISEAVAILAKKNQPDHLSLAALASQVAGLHDLEAEYSYRALVLCFETDKMDLACRICKDHSNIKKLSLLLQTHQLLSKLDSRQVSLERDLVTYLKELTEIESDPEMYESLQYTYDSSNAHPSKKSIFVMITHELCLACCAAEKSILLTHTIKALHYASKYIQKDNCEVPLVFKLSSWFCPEMAVGYLTHDNVFAGEEENVKPKIISLMAYFCFAILELMRYVFDQKINDVGDMNDYLPLIDKLITYALDKETYTYFKNQIDIKSVERRINEAYKRKSEQTNDDTPMQALTRSNVPECLLQYLKQDPDSDEKVNNISEDDIIAAETEKMNQLKAEIKKFEDSRVSAPNPAVIYCTLKNVLENSDDSEILNKVEKIWGELQVEL